MVRVPPDERRQELARAVWAVIRSQGLERASVRAVAAQAGVSAGSLRHYFASQSELRNFAMRTVAESVERRLAGLALPEDPCAAAELALSQLLPLDEERRAENEVWLAFTAGALVDPELRELRNRSYDQLRDGCHHWAGQLRPTASVEEQEWEGERLFALIDGLAVHAATRPDQATPDHLRRVLAGHLRAVAGG